MISAAAQVWWLYGPPAVGKSATAWQVFVRVLSGEPRGYLDVDQVGMCYPEPEGDRGRYALKARAAAAVIRHSVDAGARTIIVSGVLDERSLTDVVENVDQARVTFCRLRVAPEELERRLKTRYGPDEIERALIEAAKWDRRSPSPVVVDTGHGSPLDTARRLVEAVRESVGEASPVGPLPTTRPSPTPTGRPAGRAILLCGPTAVGKSTVGFDLFTHLLEAGRAAAYLDLQQLGFAADLPAGDPSRHQLTAGCVADLWAHYRVAGAQDLVLTGQLEQPADVRRYREALAPTPVLVCRLRAGGEELRKRIRDRSRGGGPPLAGDVLLGLSADAADTVLHHALAQQSHLEQTEIADVALDTNGTSSEAVAQRLQTTLDQHPGKACRE